MLAHPATQHIELWPIERSIEYPRNPRKSVVGSSPAEEPNRPKKLRNYGSTHVQCSLSGGLALGGEDYPGHSSNSSPATNFFLVASQLDLFLCTYKTTRGRRPNTSNGVCYSMSRYLRNLRAAKPRARIPRPSIEMVADSGTVDS